jgi:acyl-CoA synthetase (AMP-forming)/AMP-acid ligase II
MVPVLAALPQPGAFPWFTAGGVLVVVAVGGVVGRRALGEVARLSRLRTKVTVSTVACATSAVVLGALDVIAGGSAGQFRLSDVGVPTASFVASVFGAMMAGAVVVVVRDAWKLRR